LRKQVEQPGKATPKEGARRSNILLWQRDRVLGGATQWPKRVPGGAASSPNRVPRGADPSKTRYSEEQHKILHVEEGTWRSSLFAKQGTQRSGHFLKSVFFQLV